MFYSITSASKLTPLQTFQIRRHECDSKKCKMTFAWGIISKEDFGFLLLLSDESWQSVKASVMWELSYGTMKKEKKLRRSANPLIWATISLYSAESVATNWKPTQKSDTNYT